MGPDTKSPGYTSALPLAFPELGSEEPPEPSHTNLPSRVVALGIMGERVRQAFRGQSPDWIKWGKEIMELILV